MSRNCKNFSQEDDESGSESELQQTQSAKERRQLPPPSFSSSLEEEESENESDSDSKVCFTLVRRSPAAVEDTSKSSRKSNLFQRIWSEDDEIVILKGMIDYLATYKTDPTQDINSFHSFIKEDLQTIGSRTQLLDKIRRMKKKFEKKIKNGKEMSFSKPHDQSIYDLSKTIWGDKEKKRKRMDLLMNYCGAMTVEERMLMNGGDLFESGHGLKGEKEWKKLRVEEFKNYLKLLEVRVAQTNLVLGALTMMKHS